MLNKPNINKNKQKLIVYIILAAVTFAVFWQVNQFDFINFDDNLYVTENIHIQSGITRDTLRWAFSTNDADGLLHPLIWLSLMLDYQLHGLNAGGYHATNLILHILSTLLLFGLFCRMTNEIWKSAFVAAFFALHPLHVESVAWISERKDVLSAFFWMLTLCLYVYYTQKPAVKRYLLVLFSFVLALMSKPMVITLPLIMILLDYWPLSRFRIGIESQKGKVNPVLWQLKEKLPFFVLLMGLVIVTFYTPNKQDSPPIKDLSFISRLANAPVSFVTYLGKTFWPHDMTIFYPFPDQIPAWQVLGATILIIIITVFVIVTAKRLPYLFVGWFWFALSIFPVMGIMRIGDFAMADRYHYLPSIGLAVALAWGIPPLINNENIRRKLLFPATIVSLAFLTFLTWQQCDYWKSNVKLWNHALNVTKDNYLAHINLGSALFEKGENDKAIYHYNKALLIIKISKVSYSLGIVYSSIGKYQQAIESYNQAIRMIPDFAAAHYNLGIIYFNLGNYQQAVKNFSQAVRAAPDFTAAYYNLGVVYHLLGQNQRAIENYSEAIRLKHDYGEAYNNRALVYLNTGDSVAGCRDAKKACELGNCATMQAVAGKGLCR